MSINLKTLASHNFINILGYTTKRRIVIIESDDWGSIQMPSEETRIALDKKGCDVSHPYYKYDSLATTEDLTYLFEVLSSIRDTKGNPAIITANTIMANPDFDKIKASDFTQYFYEPFTETLKKYSHCENSFHLWTQGIATKVWNPQFHGREHLNVLQWMNALKNNDKVTRLAFDYNFFGIGEDSGIKINGGTYMRAFNETNTQSLPIQNEIIITGLALFENIFGYRSKSFIAPCYTWNKSIEKILAQNGIKYLQGMITQSSPIKINRYKTKYHFIGQKNQFGQRYLIRNAFFEPSQNPNYDWIDDCLKRIDIAFYWNKPATISTHRLNFIGAIDSRNRYKNLTILKRLLQEIIKYWPNVEFMSSDQLGNLIDSKYE